MNINTKRVRVTIYQDHKVTGFPPRWELSACRYNSADNDGKQLNYSVTLGLWTLHVKFRLKLAARPVIRSRNAQVT